MIEDNDNDILKHFKSIRYSIQYFNPKYNSYKSESKLVTEMTHFMNGNGQEICTISNIGFSKLTIFLPYRKWDTSFFSSYKRIKEYPEGLNIDIKDFNTIEIINCK